MKYKLNLLGLTFIICLFSKSQELSNTDFSVNYKKVIVSFSISGIQNSSIYSYDVCLKVLRKNNPETITPINMYGDTKGITTN